MAIAGVVASLTSCVCRTGRNCVCEENKKAGLATIYCQPMDVVVTNGQTTAMFTVATRSSSPLYYQWFFNDVAISLDDMHYASNSMIASNLTLVNLSSNSIGQVGFYYCQIQSIDKHGFIVYTETRKASLGLEQRSAIMSAGSVTLPVQPLPPAGSTGPGGPCGGVKSCSSLIFRCGTVSIPVGTDYMTVTLTNPATRASYVEPSSAYEVSVCDTSVLPPKTFCATNNGTQWYFTATADVYQFDVYFNCPAPSPATYPDVLLTLSLTPQP
jgi:hypothetical protein